MLYQQKKYLQFILKSTNQHGVHSPFIYNFITKSLYNKVSKDLWSSFIKIKQYQAKKKNCLKVKNADATFKLAEKNKFQFSNKKAKLLLHIVSYFNPKNNLEVHSSIGFAASAIKIGNQNSKVTILDDSKHSSEITQKLLDTNNFKNIEIITDNISKSLLKVTENKQYDLIFFNGKQAKTILSCFNQCLKSIHNNSVFIFEGIYCNTEMQAVWLEIKKHTKTRVTVDIFHFGIVFFRKEQEKEHFKIRV